MTTVPRSAMTEASHDTANWRAYRAEQLARRAKRLPIRSAAILALQAEGFRVEQKTRYQFRINGRLDLYPVHNRWFDLHTQKWGGALDLVVFAREWVKQFNAFQQEYRDRTQKTVGRKIIESPSVYVSSQELDWAAGLFEGEGTITIGVRRSDETYRLICMVGNTDRQVVEFFHERWGGWFQPAYGKRPGRKPAWYWTVAGPRAETFVRTIQPHLRTSRVIKKAQLALQFRASQSRLTRVWNKPGYRVVQREIYSEMRELNRRGIKILEGQHEQVAAR